MAALLLAGLALGACSRPVERAEEVRPVRAVVLAAANTVSVAEFPGEVRPRYESRLGFRVGGKILERKVEVGSQVRRGQVLMGLDPRDLQLQQAQARAGLQAAQGNLTLAQAELARYRELRAKNFVSQAVLDGKEQAYRSAQAGLDQAQAAFHAQSNQAGYASLVSDMDGVVTGIDAEAGQVVAAGTPVVRVARTDEKEIAISIPESQVDRLRKLTQLEVRVWAAPERPLEGRLRELSPMADPATRTYTAKISVPAAPPEVRLGMTAYVRFLDRSEQASLRIPLTALVRDKDGSAVWVVENGAVRQVPVQVAEMAGNDALVAQGLAAGQTVVTAGAHLLRPGQKVSILGADAGGLGGGA